MLPGCAYHLTHRCHNRAFLFRFGMDRTEYVRRLREALKRYPVSLFCYCITSNHTHLLLQADDPGSISALMQQLEGEFAEYYNRRKKRSGAFWEGRFHCTMIDTRQYLWDCMMYIELNMVRAGVVSHPSQWQWCSFNEMVGRRKRYRLIDRDRLLLELSGAKRDELAASYASSIGQRIGSGVLRKEDRWTQSVALGSEDFVKQVEGKINWRADFEVTETAPGTWTVREPSVSYS